MNTVTVLDTPRDTAISAVCAALTRSGYAVIARTCAQLSNPMERDSLRQAMASVYLDCSPSRLYTAEADGCDTGVVTHLAALGVALRLFSDGEAVNGAPCLQARYYRLATVMAERV